MITITKQIIVIERITVEGSKLTPDYIQDQKYVVVALAFPPNTTLNSSDQAPRHAGGGVS